MRPAPAPTLHNVLVSHPTTGASTALTRPDDLVAAAVLAADEAHDMRSSRPRSMLARVSRRWSRLSDALWRRRSSPSATTSEDRRRAAAAVLAAASTRPVPVIAPGVTGDSADDPPPSPPRPAQQSHAILRRERELRLLRDASPHHPSTSASTTNTSISSRPRLPSSTPASPTSSALPRVRQVGAREDDDTLLLLPRVVAPPGTDGARPRTAANFSGHKVRQLPRVSALMPMRPPGKPVWSGRREHRDEHDMRVANLASPVSSAGQASSTASSGDTTGCRSRRSNAAFPEGNAERFESASDAEDIVYDNDDEHVVGTPETWDADRFPRKRALCRLPTGLLNKDVDREVEHAVVEIASDGGDTDEDNASNSLGNDLTSPATSTSLSNRQQAINDSEQVDPTQEQQVSSSAVSTSPVTPPSLPPSPPSSPSQDMSVVTEISKVRSRSDAHHDVRVPNEQGFLRRASSSMQSGRRLFSATVAATAARDDSYKTTRPSSKVNGASIVAATAAATSSDKGRFSRSQDFALFEDDYLSFQGFHGKSSENASRSPYSGMTALLRSTRISSVTDSHSEDSDELACAAVRSTRSDSRRGRGRSGRIPMLRMMRSMGFMEEARR